MRIAPVLWGAKLDVDGAGCLPLSKGYAGLVSTPLYGRGTMGFLLVPVKDQWREMPA